MRPSLLKDTDFDSTDHTLIAHFGDPHRFIFKNYLAQLVVSVSLPEDATLEDPKHVGNVIYKLYSRVKLYQNHS